MPLYLCTTKLLRCSMGCRNLPVLLNQQQHTNILCLPIGGDCFLLELITGCITTWSAKAVSPQVAKSVLLHISLHFKLNVLLSWEGEFCTICSTRVMRILISSRILMVQDLFLSVTLKFDIFPNPDKLCPKEAVSDSSRHKYFNILKNQISHHRLSSAQKLCFLAAI